MHRKVKLAVFVQMLLTPAFPDDNQRVDFNGIMDGTVRDTPIRQLFFTILFM